MSLASSPSAVLQRPAGLGYRESVGRSLPCQKRCPRLLLLSPLEGWERPCSAGVRPSCGLVQRGGGVRLENWVHSPFPLVKHFLRPAGGTLSLSLGGLRPKQAQRVGRGVCEEAALWTWPVLLSPHSGFSRDHREESVEKLRALKLGLRDPDVHTLFQACCSVAKVRPLGGQQG